MCVWGGGGGGSFMPQPTNSGEPDGHVRLLPDLLKDLGLAVLGDVVSHFKVPESTCDGKKSNENRSLLVVYTVHGALSPHPLRIFSTLFIVNYVVCSLPPPPPPQLILVLASTH